MASLARKREIDLSLMRVDELQALIAKIERELTTRQFEEGLRKALRDYQGRDPNVIRL